MENIYFDLKRIKYLGKGAIIGKTVRIRKPEEAIIDDYTIIDDFTYISCSITTGSYCHIGPSVTISGGQRRVTMGNFVGGSCGGSIHAMSEDYVSASLNLPTVPKEFQFGALAGDVVMDDYVLLGAQCVVLPGVYLPEGFASAAHTIIAKRKYEPWVLYGGPRARKLVRREHARAVECGHKLLKRSHEPLLSAWTRHAVHGQIRARPMPKETPESNEPWMSLKNNTFVKMKRTLPNPEQKPGYDPTEIHEFASVRPAEAGTPRLAARAAGAHRCSRNPH